MGYLLAGDCARSLYVTWSNLVEITREELKPGINSKFGDIVQIVKQPLTSHPLFGHVLLKVRCDVHKDVLKGSEEVLVTINGGKVVRCYLLAGDCARSLYVTWSNLVEITREELKPGINSKFGDIVQIVKQPLTSHPLFGHVLLKVRCDVHKDVLKGSEEVLVTINGGKVVRCYLLAGDCARSLYVTWSNLVEITREELKPGINSKFGDIVQIVKQPLTSHPLFGHVLLKVRCDVHKDVLKGSEEVLVTINGGKVVRCDPLAGDRARSLYVTWSNSGSIRSSVGCDIHKDVLKGSEEVLVTINGGKVVRCKEDKPKKQ
ncbi:hypothetical protein M0R45_036762 [Rubus argutus]|uniref:Uncharacterized protein n=1 Tax=Rubus argutus TaxID=59490 RepID=A0AAW1VYF2_RUBAR